MPTEDQQRPSPVASAISTYEDAMELISSIEQMQEVGPIKEGLAKLKTFFSNRIGKRKAERGDSGADAVKKALLSSRPFKQYTVPIGTEPPLSPPSSALEKGAK